MRRGRTAQGFTLIEMMVVVIIVAVVVTGVSFGTGAVGSSRLRGSAYALVAAARYAYSRAVTQGATVRLVIDFDARTFELQETRERVVLTRDDESGAGVADPAADTDSEDGEGDGPAAAPGAGGGGGLGFGEAASALATGGGMEMLAANLDLTTISDPFLASLATVDGAGARTVGGRLGYRGASFQALPGRRGQARPLDGETTFVAVLTPHETQARTAGRAYIYFFPNGVTEHAVVQLSDGGERTWSVEIHPLSGRAIVHDEAFEPSAPLDELQEVEP